MKKQHPQSEEVNRESPALSDPSSFQEEPVYQYLPIYVPISYQTNDLGEYDDTVTSADIYANFDSYTTFNKYRAFSLQLKKTCSPKAPPKETDTNASAKIFHEMGNLYMQESPNMLSLIRAAALFNAAISRNSTDKSEVEKSLTELCYHIQEVAGCSKKQDLITQAKQVKNGVQSMRSKARMALKSLEKIPDYLKSDELLLREKQRLQKVQEIQNGVFGDYKRIMSNLCQFCEKVMGRVPCPYALVGMGSLARKEITPYSDFEHVIVLKDECQHSKKRYANVLKYFRWYSVIFHVVIINLGETIIPSVAIPDLNDKNSQMGDWFYDAYTKRGISFDGMMPHACKFPLGRMEATKDKPFSTELIKPVSEMLEFLNSNESVKQGYHLADILTKTCFVYGDFEVYKDFAAGVIRKLNTAFKTKCFEDIKTQLEEDLKNFAINRRAISELHSNAMFNVKRLVYRSTTLFVSAWGRFEGINASSSFDIVSALRDKNVISEYVKSKLMYAVALACEIRLRTYLNQDKQGDMFEPAARDDGKEHSFVEVVGKSSLINYFQVAYALQASICKYLGTNTKPSHLITDPIMFNVKVCSALGLEEMTNGLLQICVPSAAASTAHVDIFNFEDCLTYLEEGLRTNFQNTLHCYEMNTHTFDNDTRKKNMAYRYNYISKYLYHTNRFDEALHYAMEAMKIMKSAMNEKGIFDASCYELAGYCLTELKQSHQALVCFKKSEALYQLMALDRTNDNSSTSLLFYYYKGICYEMKNQFGIAAECFEKALTVSQIEISQKHVADIHFRLATCFAYNGMYVLSHLHVKKSLQIYESMASVDNFTKEIAKALSFFVKSYKWKSLKLNETKDLSDFRISFQEYYRLIDDSFIDSNISLIFLDIGRNLMDLNLFDLSYFWLQKFLSTHITLTRDLNNDRFIGHASYRIGVCLMKRTEFEHSLKYLKKALEIFERTSLDANADQDVAKMFRKIGLCYLAMKSTDKAYFNLQKSIKVYQTTFSNFATNKIAAKVFDDVGVCLMKMHQYKAALDFLRKSLCIKEDLSSNNGSDDGIAWSLSSISICSAKLNLIDESLDCSKKALTIRRRTKSTPFGVASAMNNVGLCMMAKNDLLKAAWYFEKAKLSFNDIFEFDDSLGLDAKRRMVDTLNNLGSCYLRKKSYHKALDAFSDALQYNKTMFSNNESNETMFYLLNNIGLCFMQMQSHHFSLQYFMQSLQLCEYEVFDQRNAHPYDNELPLSIAALHNNIGLCLMHTSDIEKAISYFRKSIDLYQTVDSKYVDDMTAVMRNIAVAHLNNGCYADSSRYLDDALNFDYKRSPDSENDLKTAEHFFVIGTCKKHCGLFEEALKCFELSLTTLRCLSSNEVKDKRLLQALYECGVCLNALGKSESSTVQNAYMEMSLKCIGHLSYSIPSNMFENESRQEFNVEQSIQELPYDYDTAYTNSNFRHSSGISPKRVASNGAHLRVLAPEQHSSKKTWQGWQAFGDAECNFTGRGIEPQTFQTDSAAFEYYVDWPVNLDASASNAS